MNEDLLDLALVMPLRSAAWPVLSDGDSVRIEAGKKGARVLLLAGKPIGEPIVRTARS